MTQNNELMIECCGLTKIYSELTALDNLNLEVRRGEIFGYIGHNGAGKTTTIRILAGMLKASSGNARIAGVDIVNRNRIKALVGYMPDKFGVYDQMRVWEYLDFFGAAYRIPRKQRRKRIDEVLELSQGQYLRDRFVDTLSKGMKQRVGIARTIIHDPQVLLLDEPASGLDPKARIQMRQLLKHLSEIGKTIIVSSHILPELAAICDSIGIIDHGVLQTAGEINKVLAELSRDRLMEVKVIDQIDKTREILSAQSVCSKVETEDSEMGLVTFRFTGDDVHLADILQKLYHGGVKVVTFREVPLSLEDAYMSISGIGDNEDEDQEFEESTPDPQETEND